MFSYIKKIIICIFILLYSITSYSITIDPDRSDDEYLNYGAQHECVLSIVGNYKDELHTPYRGSCVLIEDYYFLTAAHILDGSDKPMILCDKNIHLCSSFIIHDKFLRGNTGFYDIAIGKLETPIKLNFYPSLYDETNEVGKISSQAGFGSPGNFITGFDKNIPANKKRAGSNIINRIEKHLLICTNNDRPKTALECLITPGDSGGGLFIDKKLAGIHSCVFASDGLTDSNYGDESGHTRISYYIDWINTNKQLLEKAHTNE